MKRSERAALRAEVAEAIRGGQSEAEVAKKYGYDLGYVKKIASSAGVPPAPKPEVPAEILTDPRPQVPFVAQPTTPAAPPNDAQINAVLNGGPIPGVPAPSAVSSAPPPQDDKLGDELVEMVNVFKEAGVKESAKLLGINERDKRLESVCKLNPISAMAVRLQRPESFERVKTLLSSPLGLLLAFALDAGMTYAVLMRIAPPKAPNDTPKA